MSNHESNQTSVPDVGGLTKCQSIKKLPSFCRYRRRRDRTLTLGQNHGLVEEKKISIRLSKNDKPLPIVAFDFDGTLFDSIDNYHYAITVFVSMYTDDITKIPTLAGLKMGASIKKDSFYKWGVPRSVPAEDAWDMFTDIVNNREKVKPSLLFPGVIFLLKEMTSRFHPVVVTLNTIQPVEAILKKHTGLDIDVIKAVSSKSDALGELSAFDHQFHGLGTPLMFFGDSPRDMSDAARHRMVRPIGVVNERRGVGNKMQQEQLRNRLIMSGAYKLITHRQIPDTVFSFYGLVDDLD